MRRLDHEGFVGRSFNDWTVVRILGGTPCHYEARCRCGNLARVVGHTIRSGASKRCFYCGNRTRGSLTHGATARSRIAPEWNSWRAMIDRCTNRNHKGWSNYGGRGIRVCAVWLGNFEAFLADVGPRPSSEHSIDRFPDQNGNYEPGNVRWATRGEQARNRRTTRLLTVGDETLCAQDWAERLGIPPSTVYYRLQRGMSLPEALGIEISATGLEVVS